MEEFDLAKFNRIANAREAKHQERVAKLIVADA